MIYKPEIQKVDLVVSDDITSIAHCKRKLQSDYYSNAFRANFQNYEDDKTPQVYELLQIP